MFALHKQILYQDIFLNLQYNIFSTSSLQILNCGKWANSHQLLPKIENQIFECAILKVIMSPKTAFIQLLGHNMYSSCWNQN